MRACVLTQKSEEAPASTASLLATPMASNLMSGLETEFLYIGIFLEL